MSSFETENLSSEPGGCRGLEKLLQKNLKKVLDKSECPLQATPLLHYKKRGTERQPGDRRRNQGGNTFSRP